MAETWQEQPWASLYGQIVVDSGSAGQVPSFCICSLLPLPGEPGTVALLEHVSQDQGPGALRPCHESGNVSLHPRAPCIGCGEQFMD